MSITFSRSNWNYKVKLNHIDALYENTITYNVEPIVIWHLQMGLFETLEIRLGVDLNPTIERLS